MKGNRPAAKCRDVENEIECVRDHKDWT